MRTSFHFLAFLTITMSLVACGSGGDDNGSNSGNPTPPPVTDTNTKNFIIEPSSAANVLPSLNAGRNSDGTVYFTGKIGVQRLNGTQALSNQAPAKLSYRFVNVATGAVYNGMGTTSRGTFAAGDSLDGSATHNGVWYYTFTLNLGYSIPTGTMVRTELVDNGDTVAGSGDELQANGYAFYINVPLTAASNSAPIPFHTFSVPGPG